MLQLFLEDSRPYEVQEPRPRWRVLENLPKRPSFLKRLAILGPQSTITNRGCRAWRRLLGSRNVSPSWDRPGPGSRPTRIQDPSVPRVGSTQHDVESSEQPELWRCVSGAQVAQVLDDPKVNSLKTRLSAATAEATIPIENFHFL